MKNLRKLPNPAKLVGCIMSIVIATLCFSTQNTVVGGNDRVKAPTSEVSADTEPPLRDTGKFYTTPHPYIVEDVTTASTTTTTETTTTTTTTTETTTTTTTHTTTTTSSTTKKTTTTTTTTITATSSAVDSDTTTTQTQPDGALPITEAERIILVNLVAREYGANWVSVEEKAKVVACVMNRVRAGSKKGYRDDIISVIRQKGQFPGYLPTDHYTSKVTQSCIDAVEYYFAHQESFGSYKSFWGDGRVNHFY